MTPDLWAEISGLEPFVRKARVDSRIATDDYEVVRTPDSVVITLPDRNGQVAAGPSPEYGPGRRALAQQAVAAQGPDR